MLRVHFIQTRKFTRAAGHSIELALIWHNGNERDKPLFQDMELSNNKPKSYTSLLNHHEYDKNRFVRKSFNWVLWNEVCHRSQSKCWSNLFRQRLKCVCFVIFNDKQNYFRRLNQPIRNTHFYTESNINFSENKSNHRLRMRINIFLGKMWLWLLSNMKIQLWMCGIFFPLAINVFHMFFFFELLNEQFRERVTRDKRKKMYKTLVQFGY